MVYSYGWAYQDGGILIDVTEYWVCIYDDTTGKTGVTYQIYVDIGNDGYIDYIEWIPVDPEKVVTE